MPTRNVLTLVGALGLAPSPLAQSHPGWTVDTTLKTYRTNIAAAADGDLLFATRQFADETAAIEIHRFKASLDRHVLEETSSDPGWLPSYWEGGSASTQRGLGVVYSRPTFGLHPWVHVLENVGGSWTRQDVALPGFSSARTGQSVVLDGSRILSLTAQSVSAANLHFVEPDAGGNWSNVQSLELTLRTLYPTDHPNYLALDGEFCAMTSTATLPWSHFAICERDAATGRWFEDQLLPIPDPLLVPAGIALEGNVVVVGGGHSGPAAPMESVAWIFERTASGQLARRQEIRRAGAAPHPAANVVLENGRLLLGADDDVYVYERDATGTFVETAVYRGLGAPVAVLDGSLPGSSQGSGPPRIVGRDGKRMRIAPFPPAPSAGGGTPTFDVRQDTGVMTCFPTTPSAPELRYYGFSFSNRRAAIVEGAAPNSVVVTYAAPDAGFFPAAGGALCLDRTSLYVAMPPTLSGANGEAHVDLSLSAIPLPAAVGQGFHLQALVLEPNGPQLSNAVQFVL